MLVINKRLEPLFLVKTQIIMEGECGRDAWNFREIRFQA
jgi:hypothetical protein